MMTIYIAFCVFVFALSVFGMSFIDKHVTVGDLVLSFVVSVTPILNVVFLIRMVWVINEKVGFARIVLYDATRK